MDDQDKQKLLLGVFGYSHTDTKYLKDIPVLMRTLYDFEVQDALNRSMQRETIEQQVFDFKRWKLAYGLRSVNEIPMPGNLEDNYNLLTQWINFYVEQLYDLFEELCEDEKQLGEVLKNSGGTQEETQ